MQYHPCVRNVSNEMRRRKRIRIAFVLAFFLGPLGLFYTDPFGGFATFSAALIIYLILPAAGLVLIWIACMIWAVIAARKTRRPVQMHVSYIKHR